MAETQDPATGDATGAQDPKPGENSGEDLSGLKLDAKQQAHFDEILAKRLDRAKESWQKEAEAAAEKAKQAAEEARLAEAQEFQQLAQRRQQTIEDQAQELATVKEEAKLTGRYRKALEAYRDQMIQGVPEHIMALLKPMDVVDQMEWLTANAEALSTGDGEGERRYIGPPPAPGAKGENGKMSPEEKRRKSWTPRL